MSCKQKCYEINETEISNTWKVSCFSINHAVLVLIMLLILDPIDSICIRLPEDALIAKYIAILSEWYGITNLM